MKHLKLISIFALGSLAASAAVPLRWTVETSRAVPAQFEAYQGETLALEAALMSYGKPLEAPSSYSIYWQTNGMGNAWWSIPCTVPSRPSATGADEACRGGRDSTVSNVLFATWSPTNDVGARVYNCFIGQPGTIYHAAFQLRLRPSPGATPNELPLPQKVIDFAKVTVLNPPWSGGGGGGGVDTNAVLDIIHKTVDGSARTLPPYLHYLEMDDTYPDAAEEYYNTWGGGVSPAQCSSVRDGNTLSRNYDWNFDFMPEFVVRVPPGPGRFASLAVCNVGTNLTEADVSSGKWSRWYKALPGHAVDGINENGVACNINVVDGTPEWGGGVSPALHPLAAVRWILDNATNAQHAAEYIASHIAFPSGWTQNFHYMVCDQTSTYIVENGDAYPVTWATGVPPVAVLTNFRLYLSRDTTGEGQERYDALVSGENITSQWWTLTYTPGGYRASDLPGITGDDLNQLFNYWENNPRESHRGETIGDLSWWQTVHTSVYDISNRVLRICVQEKDDWYTFAVDQANVDLSPIEAQIAALQDGKRDKTDLACYVHADDAWVFDPPLPEGIAVRWLDDDPEYTGWELYEVIGGNIEGRSTPEGTRDAKDVYWREQDIYVRVTIHGRHYVNELMPTGDHIATEGGVAAAIAAHHDSTKRDRDDNTCHKTEFGKWKFDNGTVADPQPYLYTGEDGTYWLWQKPEDDEWAADGDESSTELTFIDDDHTHMTRSAVCTKDKRFVTEDVVDGKVSAAVSTNNPAFVSAVRNTPTSGIPEDMPTDWGTYGTVGAALAALAAFVKWAKANIVAVIGNDGKPTDTFAGDLLGKQVAINAMHYDKYLVLTEGADAWKLHDRAENRLVFTASTTHTFDFTANAPTAITGKCRDFLLDIVTDAAVDFTTTGATIKGDSLDIAGQGEYLIAVTERYDGSWYVRNIEMKDPQ